MNPKKCRRGAEKGEDAKNNKVSNMVVVEGAERGDHLGWIENVVDEDSRESGHSDMVEPFVRAKVEVVN